MKINYYASVNSRKMKKRTTKNTSKHIIQKKPLMIRDPLVALLYMANM